MTARLRIGSPWNQRSTADGPEVLFSGMARSTAGDPEKHTGRTFASDRPVSDISRDKLSRAGFARRLAGTLARRGDPSRLVIALYGKREALALRWEDSDWNGSRVLIRRSLSRGQLGTPKSGRARSAVLSPAPAASIVRVLLARRRGERLEPGGPAVGAKRDPDVFERVGCRLRGPLRGTARPGFASGPPCSPPCC